MTENLNSIMPKRRVYVYVLLGEVYVPGIYRMQDGVIVGDSGLCGFVPVQCVTSIVRVQVLITSHCLLIL